VVNYIRGTTGNDTLKGTPFVDVIVGDLGDDIIDGDAGDDIVDYRGAANGVRVDLAITGPQDTRQGRDTLISIEGVYGSAYDDVLRGDAGRNEIHGVAGNDWIDGRSGEDAIWGDLGDDEIHGGDGEDVLYAGDGDDLVYGDADGDVLDGGDGADILHGGDGRDWFFPGAGDDLLYGDADNDIFFRSYGLDIIDGGDGSDTITFADYWRAVTVDLRITGVQTFAPDEQIGLTSVENIEGTAADDTLTGDAASNSLTGGAGADTLDGGAGGDTAVFFGLSTDYTITKLGETWQVEDTRFRSPDGVDTLKNIEFLKFSNALIPIGDGWSMLVGNLLRTSTAKTDEIKLGLSGQVSQGVLSADKVFSAVATLAGATTSVATMAYEFFTGKIPGQAGIDYLVSTTGLNPNNLSSAYYQSFNLENRYINFAVNLGKVGEGKDAFAAKYGALSLFDATREAYKTIFGAAPTDAKVHALIDSRVDYFASYGGDGPNGIGAKAAMVGWLLAEAVKADVGVMAKSNEAWLMDLADGDAPFGVDILDATKGYYSVDFIFGG